MWRSAFAGAMILAIFSASSLAQTSQDLKADAGTTGDVLVYGMGYSGQRFSPLTQINKENVGRLVPVWAYSLADLQGGEGFPLVKDGVIYVTTHNATVAVDALSGKQVWRVIHDYPPETLRVVCCGIVNRGAAIYEGLIIRALMDDRLVALDAATGKEVWTAKSPDPVSHANGYAMTGAPLIVDGVVIMGVAGAEYSHRGLVEGYDAKTGNHLWRLYTIPAKGEPGSETWEGDFALTGGGSSWVTGTYDPELDLVYWGIGNPAPWNPRARKGDNLFTNSIFAIRPKTGERVWYFQATPQDPFDYDAVQTPVIATINVDGSPRKVVVQANRSGFLYVLDAKDGRLIAANAYDKINWADGVDRETGRPIGTDVLKGALEGRTVTVWPSVSGVTNWQHMSFSPRTGMLYINTIHVGMTYQAPEPPKLAPGKPSGPGTVKRTTVTDDPNVRGFLKAVDPLTGKSKWETPYKKSELFLDHGDRRQHRVHRRDDGRVSGVGCRHRQDPVELSDAVRDRRPTGHLGRNGKQYVTVMSGIGGVYAQRAGDPNLENLPTGVSLWTFALFDK